MAQHLIESQQRADCVTIGPRVRGEQKSVAPLDLLEDLVDHSERRTDTGDLCLSFPLRAPQQLVNTRRVLLRAVNHKHKLRSVAQAHTLCELVTNESLGCIQSFKCLLCLLFIAVHPDEHTSRFASGRKHDLGNSGEPNPWITEFAFENEVDLLSQSLHPPLTLVLGRAWFNHGKLSLKIKLMRIPESQIG